MLALPEWSVSTLDTVHCMSAISLLKALPSNYVNCVVTSPPYWGLRDYGVPGQIGLEPTMHEFIERMVILFREVRRVLRDDGTLWLNLGDSYNGGGTHHGNKNQGISQSSKRQQFESTTKVAGLKPKDLCGIPWRVALALQDDGWWLRSAAPWVKGSAMPESVTDRATTAHEYVFQFSKSAKYWFDSDAVRKNQVDSSHLRAKYGWKGRTDDNSNGSRTGSSFKRMAENGEPMNTIPSDGGRNRRTSDTFYEYMDAQIAHWQYIRANGGALIGNDTIDAFLVNPKGFDAAHFATYPMALIDPCVKAGCPPQVCVECGAPYERVVEVEHKNYISRQDRQTATGGAINGGVGKNFPDTKRNTLGWRPTCDCHASTRPGIVYDPFMGAGTTALVAIQNGRHYIGSELNPEYVQMARQRIAEFDPFQPVEHEAGITQLSLFAEAAE